MKPLDSQKPDVVNQTRSNPTSRHWRGQFTPGSVMANSASDARASEQEIRQKLIESRALDVMVAVGPNMFSVHCLPKENRTRERATVVRA